MAKRLHLGLAVAGALCALWLMERGTPAPRSAATWASPAPVASEAAPPPVSAPSLAIASAPASTRGPESAPAPSNGDEEREAQRIDALVALDRIGEAHSAAMAFIRHHPSGPYSAHVMNLMGVHPRPPGALPQELEESR